MRFSVVIPCYNAGRWIGRALESVQEQSYAPHEILVIDDGSTDDSLERIRSSGVDVQLLQTNRANGAGARNAGIRAATGEWVAFLDADDIWYPKRLERIARLLESTDDVAYLSLTDSFSDKDEEILRQQNRWPIEEPTGGLAAEQFLNMNAKVNQYTMPATAIRRDRLLQIDCLDTTQVRRHDIDLWLRAICGQTWAFDPVASVAFRRDSPNSISRNIANREYFFLRALLKSQQNYDCDVMDHLVRVAAKRAMSGAFTDGDADDRRRAFKLAYPQMRRRDQLVFTAFRPFPSAFRWLNLRRRKRVGI